jgi:hypothetical protein
MVAIATKQTILAILGCKKRYFAASEVSQISFDKICNICKIYIAVFPDDVNVREHQPSRLSSDARDEHNR